MRNIGILRLIAALLIVLVCVNCNRPKTIIAKSNDGTFSMELPGSWSRAHNPIADKEQSSFIHEPTETVLGVRTKSFPKTQTVDPDLAIERLKSTPGSRHLLHGNGAVTKPMVLDGGAARSISGLAIANGLNAVFFTITLTADAPISDSLWHEVETAVVNCRISSD